MNNSIVLQTLHNHEFLDCDCYEELAQKYIGFHNLDDIFEGICYIDGETAACNFLDNNKCSISIGFDEIENCFITPIINKYNDKSKSSLTDKDIIDLSNMIYIFTMLHELNHVRQYKNYIEGKLSNENNLYMNYVAKNTINASDVEFYEKFKNFNIIEYDANIKSFTSLLDIYEIYDIKVSSRAMKAFNMYMASYILSSYIYNDEVYSPVESAVIMAKEKDDVLPNVSKNKKDDKSFVTLYNGWPLKEKRIKKLKDYSSCKKTTKNLIKSLYR